MGAFFEIYRNSNKSMKRFEYMTLDITASFWGSKINSQDLTDKLNELGRAGWELVSTADLNWAQGATKGLILILKREL